LEEIAIYSLELKQGSQYTSFRLNRSR